MTKQLHFSVEIIPPIRGNGINKSLDLLDKIVKIPPRQINVTSHSAVFPSCRKRLGTIGLCAIIQHKYCINAVPHILCNGFSRQETEDFLIECSYLKLNNIMCLRGDGFRHVKSSNDFAIDLIKQVHKLNNGIYLNGEGAATNFHIGIAGYPEKHYMSTSMELDIDKTIDKIEEGANYIITQMFFDNSKFFWYRDKIMARYRARYGRDLAIPIIPGLKTINSKKHIELIPRRFYCEIPKKLISNLDKANKEDIEKVGIDWTVTQMRGLLDRGINTLHFFIGQGSSIVDTLTTINASVEDQYSL